MEIKSAPLGQQGLDLPFFRRLLAVALALIGLITAGAAIYSRLWAVEFAAVGLWMAGNAVVLGALLWAATSQPKRPFTVFVLVIVKIAWLAGLFCGLWFFRPLPSAIMAGLLVFFVAVVGSVLQWMETQSVAASQPTSQEK